MTGTDLLRYWSHQNRIPRKLVAKNVVCIDVKLTPSALTKKKFQVSLRAAVSHVVCHLFISITFEKVDRSPGLKKASRQAVANVLGRSWMFLPDARKWIESAALKHSEQQKQVARLKRALHQLKWAAKSAVAGAEAKATLLQSQVDHMKVIQHRLNLQAGDARQEAERSDDEVKVFEGRVAFLQHEIEVLQELIRFQRAAFIAGWE